MIALARCLVPFVLAATLAVAAAPARPNLLFILADDQAPWAIGAAGHPQVKTPNMDRIAREGARFTHALTPTPVCSPARASIMTSRYGTEVGILDWINPAVDKDLGLPADLPTWPSLLQKAGYATALFGKWHLGDRDDQHPTQRGYATFAGFRGGGNSPKDPTLEIDGVTAKRPGFIVDLVADYALDWLRGRDAAQPFAASIHFREPHAAYLPVRDEDWAKVKDLDPIVPNPDYPGLDIERAKKLTRDYLASVTAIDRNLGRILALLDERGLAANTLVIYTSDHGYNIGHHGIWHKGNATWLLKKEFLPPAAPNIDAGRRPNMFDTSLHVPLAIRWPGVIRPGTVETRTVSHLDWLPTFAAITGATIPVGTTLRGRDISPILRGTAKTWDNDFYAEYSMRHGATVHMRTIRTPEWKLMRDFNSQGRDELYHLAADPDETRNLIADASPATKKILAALDARILAQMEALQDPALPLARARR
jgi:uncharacterized sulfatase